MRIFLIGKLYCYQVPSFFIINHRYTNYYDLKQTTKQLKEIYPEGKGENSQHILE